MDADGPMLKYAARKVGFVWVGVAAAYFAAAAGTIHLTSNGRDIATVWPANAILVALLLLGPRPRWRTILSAGFAGNLAANLVTRGSLAGPIIYSVANLVEVALAVALLRRGDHRDGLLSSPGTLLRFILVAGILAPVTSAILGGLTAFFVYDEPLRKSALTWVASDGLGLLVFTPFFLAVFGGDFVACFSRKTWMQRAETLGLLIVLGTIAIYVFLFSPLPLLFAIFPPLMLITFRVGRLGTKAGVMLIAIIGGIATMHGQGPIALLTSDPGTQARFFQVFLAATLLTCLPAAAEMTARGRRTDALAEHDQQMTLAAFRDPLTGALNRAGFEAEASALMKSASSSISLIAIDFDHFKRINDRWGHQAGDLALQHVTSVLHSNVRAHDLVARTGGDEFVVMLPNSDLELAMSIAERIQAGVHGLPLAIDDTSVALIRISMGVASSYPGESHGELMVRADRALYEAKDTGRARLKRAR